MYTIKSDITEKSNVTAGDLDAAMKKIRGDHLLEPALGAIIAAEKKYGINALFMAAHAATESGWGHSFIARTKKNLFGFNAIDSNPGQASRYKSVVDSVNYYAQFLATHYIDPKGKYFNGATPSGVMTHYASAGDKAAATIVSIMNSLSKHLGVEPEPVPDGFPVKDKKKDAQNAEEAGPEEVVGEYPPEENKDESASESDNEPKKNTNQPPTEPVNGVTN